MNRWLVVSLLFPACLLLMGAGKQADSFIITIHEEATADEVPKFATPVKLGTEMRQYFFKRVPTFTDRDVAYFYPFISQDGATFGAGLKLTPKATEALKAHSLTHQGKLLGIRVSNAPYNAVMIDQPVDDGVIVIWQGLAKAHLKAFEKKFPHVEQANPGATPDPTAVSLPR